MITMTPNSRTNQKRGVNQLPLSPEIAAALGISPNTVKTHNRNIFAKMQVSSQRELLMTYIDILKKRRDR